MAKSLAFLSYEFFFDPADTWQHVFQFEQEFSSFLKGKGLEAQFVDSINPKDARRILYIRKIPVAGEMGKNNAKNPPQITKPQDVIKKYSDPKTYGGKK